MAIFYDQSIYSSAMYSFLCPLEQVWEVSEFVMVDLELAVLPSGTYTPGKTSPQPLHFSINIGTKLTPYSKLG